MKGKCFLELKDGPLKDKNITINFLIISVSIFYYLQDYKYLSIFF